MIEHHFVVIYNSTTGSWYMDEENVVFPDGMIYDTSDGQFLLVADDEVDENMKAYSMLSESIKELTKQTDKLVEQ
jgi:hypothetical protein